MGNDLTPRSFYSDDVMVVRRRMHRNRRAVSKKESGTWTPPNHSSRAGFKDSEANSNSGTRFTQATIGTGANVQTNSSHQGIATSTSTWNHRDGVLRKSHNMKGHILRILLFAILFALCYLVAP